MSKRPRESYELKFGFFMESTSVWGSLLKVLTNRSESTRSMQCLTAVPRTVSSELWLGYRTHFLRFKPSLQQAPSSPPCSAHHQASLSFHIPCKIHSIERLTASARERRQHSSDYHPVVHRKWLLMPLKSSSSNELLALKILKDAPSM